jgi:hypothetical protein
MLAEYSETVSGYGVPPALHDGFEIHQAALRYGLNVTLYPRQVLMASRPGDGTELTFVHGIPQASTLAAVTYTQDKRMRRELLARAGLPVPDGGTFAIGSEVRQARRLARRIGYPVVLKPAGGDNMSEVLPARNGREFAAAIEYLRVPETDRPTFTRAAYGMTMFQELEEDDDGRTMAPSSYQFLVERRVSGQYLRLLVLADKVISVVYCRDGQPGAPGGSNSDIMGDVHPSIPSLAVRAGCAVPGLSVAAVDVVVTDYTRPLVDQEYWIVDLSERPWLVVQAHHSEELSQRCAGEILLHQAALCSVSLGSPRDKVSIRFRAEGMIDPDGAIDALQTASEELGLVTTTRVSDAIEGIADGAIHGPAHHVARLLELLVGGRLHGQRALLVESNHEETLPG